MMELRIGTGSRRATMYFGEHSRELISAELALRFVKKLCKGNRRGALPLNKAVRQVLSAYEIQIFPNINVDGRKLVEQGHYCHRTNKRGVDLNRNWDAAWESGGTKETAPGSGPFSEPETKLLRDLLEDYSPSVFMSIHSGALGMYTPYAYKKDKLITHKNPQVANFLTQSRHNMFQVLADVNRDYCRCSIGAAAVALNYLCPGNCMDYAFDKLQIPYSFAFEVWDGEHYANKRTTSLIEASGEAMLDALYNDDHEHHHDHDHDHEMEEESEGEAEGDDHYSLLALHEKLHIAPKPQRGHSCFTNFDNFAPTDELEGFIEVASSASPGPVFPTEGVTGERYSCLKQFNPLTKELYEATVEHWSDAFLEIFKKLPADPSLKFPQTIN